MVSLLVKANYNYLPSTWLVCATTKHTRSPLRRLAITLSDWFPTLLKPSVLHFSWCLFPSAVLHWSILLFYISAAQKVESVVVCSPAQLFVCMCGALIRVWCCERFSCSGLKSEFPSACVRNFPLTHEGWGVALCHTINNCEQQANDNFFQHFFIRFWLFLNFSFKFFAVYYSFWNIEWFFFYFFFFERCKIFQWKATTFWSVNTCWSLSFCLSVQFVKFRQTNSICWMPWGFIGVTSFLRSLWSRSNLWLKPGTLKLAGKETASKLCKQSLYWWGSARSHIFSFLRTLSWLSFSYCDVYHLCSQI